MAMNGTDFSTAAIPELVPLTGIGGSARPGPRSAEAIIRPAVDEAPDAEIAIANSLVRVHAMFHVDPETRKVHVSVVDESGKLVRLIPPESVSEMLAAMASYPARP
jgi:hypothetical protein